MIRKSFLAGLSCGVVVGALAIVNVAAYLQNPTPPSLGPLPPATWGTVTAVNWNGQFVPNFLIVPSDPLHPMPPNAVPFEFNGMQFYVLPLRNNGRA